MHPLNQRATKLLASELIENYTYKEAKKKVKKKE